MSSNPNMTYEELQEQVAELLREMYRPSDQILKEDVPKVIQLFATLCAEVIGEYELEYPDLHARIRNRQREIARTRLAQLTTKNTEEENV